MDEDLKVLAVIPARGGSKGVPNKNKRTLGGKPLISYVIEAAQESKQIDKLVLSSDSEDIVNIGKELKVDVPFVRPEALAGDHVQLVTVIKYVYDYYKDKGQRYDAILSIQPTCPFTSAQTIDKVIEIWKTSQPDSVATVSEITQGHPYIAKRFNSDTNDIEDFCDVPKDQVGLNRSKRKKAYFLTGGIYLRANKLLEQEHVFGHCLGQETKGVIVSEEESVDINTEMDFKYAELLISSGMESS